MLVDIGGVRKELSAYQENIGGVLKEATGGFNNINGVLYPLAMSKGTPIGELAVGDIVKTNVNGVSTNFMIVHQGLPSSVYDESCNGTWLLMQDAYKPSSDFMWSSSGINDYENSDIHSYLNNTFINLFDDSIKNIIKQVKIPYTKGSGGYSSNIQTGANGLVTKVFSLSIRELGNIATSAMLVEGEELKYFEGINNSFSNEKRVAYLNGEAVGWWARTPQHNKTNMAVISYTKGELNAQNVNNKYWNIRPAIILPSDTAFVDGDFNIVV
jgi:hypothetical protein